MVLKIRELRKSAGLSQVQLADSMGVTQSVVSNWETEVFLPRVMQLPLLAGVLGCSYDDLFVEPPFSQYTA